MPQDRTLPVLAPGVDLRLLADLTAHMVWIARPDDSYVYVNRQWVDYCGFDVVEMNDLGWSEAVHPDERERTAEAWRRALATGHPYENVYRLRRGSDRTYRWFLTRAVPVKDDAGRIAYWFGTNTDIHVEKTLQDGLAALAEASAALARSLEWETTLSTVARIAFPKLGDFGFFDVVEEWDAGGQPAVVRRIAHACDPKIESLLAGTRWVRSERRDKNLCALSNGASAIHPAIDDAWLRDVAVAPAHYELMVALGFHSMLTVPLVVAGRTVGSLTTFYGASPRKHDDADVALAEELARRSAMAVENARLYRELQASIERAKQADLRKDQFLAMLGHELRNPLAPIFMALDVMKLKDPGGMRERDIIERQARQLGGLVNDLLDVSRVTRGKIELRREAVDLVGAIQRAVEMASVILAEKRHSLTLELAPGLRAHADPVRVTQIVANLVSNAARYTPPRGHIAIRARVEGVFAVIEVRDDGAGIGAELLPHIFEPFVQGERSEDRAEGGLGLGLSIVKSLVELHGGTVSAESEGPGKGSTFGVRLPLAQQEADAPKRDGPAPALASRRILVVDDNADAAEMLVAALRAVGHQVQIAHDGHSAAECARAFRPEVAVLDIGLPGMNGYELAGVLRAQDAGVRLVALTGFGQDADRARAEAAGFVAHLVKPADLRDVLRVIA